MIRLQSQLEESKLPAAEDALSRIADAMKYLPKGPDESSVLNCQKAQLLLESSVETCLISELGSFQSPVAARVGHLWKFPSDHPPIAAMLMVKGVHIKTASWNVLNRHYYKYIDLDTQGLKGSEITKHHEAETREKSIIQKIQEMLENQFHVLSLQECWPELLEQLQATLSEKPGLQMFQIICSGQEQDKNQEAINDLNILLESNMAQNKNYFSAVPFMG